MEAVFDQQNLPGPAGLELWTWALRIKWDALSTYTALHENYGDAFYLDWINTPCFFLSNPDGVAHVLKSNHTNYMKKNFYTQIKPLLGEGLLTSNGEMWRNQRKLVAQQFHGKAIDGYVDSIRNLIDEQIENLPDGLINVDETYASLTLRMAGRIFFGAEVNGFVQTIGENLSREMGNISESIRSLFTLSLMIPTPSNLRRKRNLRAMKEVVQKIIQDNQGKSARNVLGKLKAHGGMTDKIIQDEVMTLLLAGHETTSNHLMWTTYFLALHPEWQNRILNELRESGKKASELNRVDLDELKILRSVLHEALRLMPPVPGIARTAIEDDLICGLPIKAGTTVMIHPWVLHRSEQHWKNALSFEPERFFHRSKNSEDYTFIPFARGPRGCIGEDLAMVEASLILARMVESFEWKLSPGFYPIPIHQLTLRSSNGMWLKLKKRVS